MSTFIEEIREKNLSLAKMLEAHVRRVGGDEVQSERRTFIAFLNDDLLPHTGEEKQQLYALVDTLVRKYGKATATMAVDREFIADYVSKIEEITDELATATDGERTRLLQRLRESALRLEATLELHLAKEERVYLPLLEQHRDEVLRWGASDGLHPSYGKEKENWPQERSRALNATADAKYTSIGDLPYRFAAGPNHSDR